MGTTQANVFIGNLALQLLKDRFEPYHANLADSLGDGVIDFFLDPATNVAGELSGESCNPAGPQDCPDLCGCVISVRPRIDSVLNLGRERLHSATQDVGPVWRNATAVDTDV